jgi:hypothetical protein
MNLLQTIFCLSLFCASSGVQAQNSLLADGFSQGLIRDGGLLRPLAELQVTESVEQAQGFEQVAITLTHPTSGKVRLLLKGVEGFREQRSQRFKTLLLVSGFDTGAASVRLLGDIPNAVLVGFQYPFGLEDFEKNPQAFLEFFRRTPAHIALALQWLSGQPWVDRQGLVAVGVSLGGIFLPSSLFLAQKLGAAPSHTIFICTGADLKQIAKIHLEGMIASRADDLGRAITWATLPLNPQIYLPLLSGNFLSLRTDHDQTIPLASSLRLESLLRGPLTVQVLAGPHIDVDQDDVIAQVKSAIRNWLAL